MSYFIPLTGIARRVFVADVTLQLLLVREKNSTVNPTKKLTVCVCMYVYIMGNLLATRFVPNGGLSGNTYIKI